MWTRVSRGTGSALAAHVRRVCVTSGCASLGPDANVNYYAQGCTPQQDLLHYSNLPEVLAPGGGGFLQVAAWRKPKRVRSRVRVRSRQMLAWRKPKRRVKLILRLVYPGLNLKVSVWWKCELWKSTARLRLWGTLA